MGQVCILLFFLITSFVSFDSHAVVKGSESVVSVEATASFPAIDSDNTMLGFGWFKNGFTLEDSSTTCTFDSVYPVSGNVNLNGGDLYLSRGLIFQNVTDLQSLGNIFANDYCVELCYSITELSSTCTFHDVCFGLIDDLRITDTITFEGVCMLKC